MLFTDQMGNAIHLPCTPKRIVSLVPSQTELLFDLGLNEQVVGITKFCIHPAGKFKSKAKVGGTKDFNIEKIRALQPDLIIGNKEENEEQGIKQLMKEFPVWMSDIANLEDALQMIEQIAVLVGKEANGKRVVADINANFVKLKSAINNQQSPIKKVAYFIWKDPYMVAAGNTFIDDMLQRCGWQNAVLGNRYPALSVPEIAQAQPDVILLSSEPYPFKEKHIAEFAAMCPQATVKVVDGEFFSWYGSRIQHAPEYFIKLLDTL